MPSVSTCPKCRQPVTIPDGVSRRTEVRCPLCAVVYPLGDAMAELPPLLVPVETGGISADTAEAAPTPEANLITEPYHVSDPAGAEAQPQPAIDAWKKVDATPSIDTGDVPGDAGAAAGFGISEQEEDQRPGDASPAGPPRKRKKKEKSALRYMVEVVGGGFAGLLIGYYLLCWFGGNRFDLPKLPLPWLPHTMRPDVKPAEDNKQPPVAEAADSPKDPSATQPRPGRPNANMPTENIETPVESSRGDADDATNPPDDPSPEPLPKDYIGPGDPPTISSDDLGDALKAAYDAADGLDEAADMTAEVYDEFRRLGHAITFVESIPDDTLLKDRRQYAQGMLADLAESPRRINDVGRLAGILLGADQPQGGTLLAGVAGTVAQSGRLHGTVVKLAAHSESITVLSKSPLPVDAGQQVLVLGSVVGNPSENLVGYSGSKPLVVWSGLIVGVPKN